MSLILSSFSISFFNVTKLLYYYNVIHENLFINNFSIAHGKVMMFNETSCYLTHVSMFMIFVECFFILCPTFRVLDI